MENATIVLLHHNIREREREKKMFFFFYRNVCRRFFFSFCCFDFPIVCNLIILMPLPLYVCVSFDNLVNCILCFRQCEPSATKITKCCLLCPINGNQPTVLKQTKLNFNARFAYISFRNNLNSKLLLVQDMYRLYF